MSYRIESLGGHDRSAFVSGSDALDTYFHRQVSQDVRRLVASCFVAVDASGAVAGYYTLASASVPLIDLPLERVRKLPRYSSIPAVLLGRLAVSRDRRRKGLGASMVADALIRAKRSEIAAYALLVDAKDVQAVAFYQHLGFETLGKNRLFHALGGIAF